MRIAFVLPINGMAGGLNVVYRHASYLKRRGHDVAVIFVSLKLGKRVTSCGQFDIPTYGLREAVKLDLIFDQVIATWWETFFDIFRIPAEQYLYFCQSDERRFYLHDRATPYVEITYREKSVSIVTEAKWIQKWLGQEFDRADVRYAPNGVDLKLFNSLAVPVGPRGKTMRVLIEGSGASPFKRVDFAFRVASKVADIELWFVTNDAVVNSDWKFDRIFSRVPLPEMPAIYASCDVLLKLSSVEGVAGPPLEMMACGGTAVVSRATGFDEYMVDRGNCLLVDIDNAEQAVAALKELRDNPALRKNLSIQGIATSKNWDWEQQCPIFEEELRTHFLARNQGCQYPKMRMRVLSFVQKVGRRIFPKPFSQALLSVLFRVF